VGSGLNQQQIPGRLTSIPWWGARWTPPPPFVSAIRCHQKSKEHIQLGWVVRWPLGRGSSLALSTPPGHPAAGRCFRVVPVLPLLLCTRPARAPLGLRLGVKAPLAPRQLPQCPVESSPGLVLSSMATGDFRAQLAFRGSRSQIEAHRNNAPRGCAQSR
jgi:hypothetical protein